MSVGVKIGSIIIAIVFMIFAIAHFIPVQSKGEDIDNAAADSTEEIANATYETIPPTEQRDLVTETISEETQTKYYTDEDITMIAKVMWTECRGVLSDTEKACVAWTILNRVDADDSKTIAGVIKAKHQFAWDSSAPVDDDLYALAEDVLIRWNREKNGETNVGRVLPSDYTYFKGSGGHNYFRNKYEGGDTWNYSLPSPYDT